MVKAKKKNLSEFAQQKRAQKNKKQLNPFEVHINRDKQNVLGRKSKNDRGLPGVSRAKAINKRKHSLLQEYKLKNKDNVFLDKRIGERNSAMSSEDKAMARFAMERMKMHKKKNIFNLNDDEVLTHRGQTLEEIEKFDDPKSDDEFDDDVSGKLDRNFVEEAHFGGGVLSRADSTLSRKDLIDQLIAESKKRKAEKQKIREQTIDLTEKLDSEWKDLLPIVSASKKSKDDSENVKADAYDIAVRQLIFEARGNPSEKLKSEEEIIQEEKKKLEQLETDRLARMKGFVSDTSNRYKHKSADDLDDGFMVEAVVDDTDDNDINSLVNDVKDISDEEDSNIDNNEVNDADINDEEKTNESESIAEKDTIKTRKDDNESREKPCSESSNDANNSEIDLNNKDSKTEELDGEESEDSLADLKVSDSSSEDEGNKTIEKHVKFAENLTKGQITQTNQLDQICPKSLLKQNNDSTYVENVDKNKQEEIRNDLLKRKEIMEEARKELPYTYDAPESFDELEKLLENHNAEYQSIIIDRIIKCNHWTLNGKNKEKMTNLFVYLLQHINNYASTENADDLIKCFQIFNRLCPYLYDLAHLNPSNTKNYVEEVLKEKYHKFAKNKKRYPGMDTLIFFKLVSLLFPTSDFRHPIVTPCLVFMSEILLRAHIKKYRSDISKGLFICTLILEYTVLSKRFAPSVINFLRGIIYAATEMTQKVKIIPPFKTTFKVLVISSKTEITIDDLNGANMFARDLVHEELDEEFRIKALLTAVNLIIEFKNQLQELEAVYSIFEPIHKLLKINKFKKYPQNIRSHIKQLRKDLKLLQSKKLEYIVLEKKKPKPLRTYEPKIMTVYDGKHHKPMSKEKAEREKLLHKYKREFKGAIREIRRDRDFLTKVQIAQQIKSDAERKRKVIEIYGNAAMQQSELKKMRRKK
ncbi:nucleolar protein 14 homolog [Anoplolepis gracilipes]|uniref:nucleolar protein 14 homolog n=1 Tax=Anoplolepis gracilipes TaxID=354296 RepID=UPI003B9EC855